MPTSPDRNAKIAAGLRIAAGWLRLQWARIRPAWRPPDYTADPAYANAKTWLSTFKPSATAAEGYDKALQYAWQKFAQAASASETLDKKADNLMRNAGLVAGLLGLAINTFKVVDPRLLIPSLIAFIVSMIFAVIACNPTGGASTASIHTVMDDIGAGHSSDAWVAASLHCAVIGRTCLNNWKGSRIRISAHAFCAGLLLLLLPVLSLF